MKKTTFLAAFCCLALLSNAQKNEPSATPAMEIASSEEINQELITNSDGIEVYYSSTKDNSGNTLLDIRFENTTSRTISFTWEISKEDHTFNGQKSILLNSGESFNQRAALEVKGTTILSDYSITLIKK